MHVHGPGVVLWSGPSSHRYRCGCGMEIREKVAAPEVRQERAAPDALGLFRPGFNYRGGVGFWSCRRFSHANRDVEYANFRAAKVGLDVEFAEAMAADIVRVCSDVGLTVDFVTAPPQGVDAAWHFASGVARAVAASLGCRYEPVFQARIRGGKSHHPLKDRAPATVIGHPTGRGLLVDDIATSGVTMREALLALWDAGVDAVGLVWVYGERQ